MEGTANSKEVGGLVAPSSSSTRALELPKQSCISTYCTTNPQLPAALCSSVELSIKTQATYVVGASGELWSLRPQPGPLSMTTAGILEVKSRFGISYFSLQRVKLQHLGSFTDDCKMFQRYLMLIFY